MSEFEELELKISKFLRYGVLISAIFMLIGLIINFKFINDPFTNLQHYSPADLMDFLEVHFMSEEWGALISYLGLFILISLPIIRVFLTTILFIKQKEFLMASLAGMVLLGLFVSFSLGMEL